MSRANVIGSCPPVPATTRQETLDRAIAHDSWNGAFQKSSRLVPAPSRRRRSDVTANAAGVYVVNFLPAGRYTVTASLTGFKSVSRQNVVLEVGQTLTLDFRLEVGGREEVITVTEEAPPLDRGSPQMSTVIGTTQLKELPLGATGPAS